MGLAVSPGGHLNLSLESLELRLIRLERNRFINLSLRTVGVTLREQSFRQKIMSLAVTRGLPNRLLKKLTRLLEACLFEADHAQIIQRTLVVRVDSQNRPVE